MPLASGAHVKIGSVEYQLDEATEGHYVHTRDPVFVSRVDIEGEPGKQQTDPRRLLWSMTDWAGGEGSHLFYPDTADQYNYAGALNPRFRGQLTVRPRRARTTVAWVDQRAKPMMAVADGAAWVAGADEAYYSTNGTSWTAQDPTLNAKYISALPGEGITAIAGDPEYLYFSAWNKNSPFERIIRAGSTSAAFSDVVSEESTNAVPHAGLALYAGRLYGWTGRRLHEYDVFNSWPLASDKIRKVYDTGVDPVNTRVFGTTWFADCIATDRGIAFFYSGEAQSAVYEYVNGVGRILWKPPTGFTIKAIGHHLGVVFVSGHWPASAQAAGKGMLYAIPLDTRRPVFIAGPRKNQLTGLHLQTIAPSYENNILFASTHLGHVWNYDMNADGLSLIDDLTDAPADGDGLAFTDNDHRIGALLTYGTKRIAAVYRPGAGAAGTVIQMVSYDDDHINNREDAMSVSEQLFSPDWDAGFPMDVKTLTGFHVTFKVADATTTSGLVANSRITVSYSLDGGSYTDTTTITSTTTPSGTKGRVFIAAPADSNSKKFFRLTIRITLDNNATDNVAGPVLYGVTTEANLATYQETWELVVRTKDMLSKTRTSSKQRSAEQQRDDLFTLMDNRNLVTFLDGYRSKQNAETVSHTVYVDRVEDIVNRHAEGVTRVTLRAIPV